MSKNVFCSLMIFRNGSDRKFLEKDYYRLGKMAGFDWIEVQHPLMIGKNSISMRGFQGVFLTVSEHNGRYNYEYEFTKNKKTGEPKRMAAPLTFFPDEETGELLAIIPDTEYNRNVLAKQLASKNPSIIVTDPKIKAEILEKSKDFKRFQKIEKDKDGLLVGYRKELSAKDQEIENLKAKLKASQDAERIVGEVLGKDDKDRIKQIREEERKLFYKNNPELIESIKKENEDSKGSWAFSERYRNEVMPNIDEAVRKRADAEGLVWS